MGSSNSFDWSSVVGVLVVILIIGIFFLPNGLVNTIRQPNTRVNGEFRTIATALFDYHNLVASTSDEIAQSSGMKDPFGETEFRFGQADEIWPALFEHTQNERLKDWPPDPFDPDGEGYQAGVLGATFVLISLAEDGILNVKPEEIESAISDGTLAKKARVIWAFSPTNGTGSSGDLLRVSY